MKVLITGGNGFIARNLFEQLSGEYNILAPNSSDLNLLDYAGVCEYIKDNKFDVVIHTATYDAAPKHSIKDPSKVLENNLRMFFNIVRCDDYFGKMIYFGSGAEFDRSHWKPKMDENYFGQYVPQDQYGFSKYIMTKYAKSNGNIYNLRLFGVFGKYDDWRTRFIPNACCHAVFNLPIRINQNKAFDFLYIDDLTRIVKWFIENKPKNKVYNLCTGKVIDFMTVAEKIISLSGKKIDILVENEAPIIEYSGENILLMDELKDFVFAPLDQSIKTLYDWYDQNRCVIDRNKLN